MGVRFTMDDDPLKQEVEGRVGQVLKGKWRIDSLIGVGGMAAVYAATHRNSKRVAVKMLHSYVSNDGGVRRRFLREGYAANRVGHPGAVDILDDDVTDDGSAFLVMELLEGENLDRRMRRKGGRLPAAEVLSVGDQVLDVLAAAHARGILHRDIKPENVFLTRAGTIKLLDFGIARVLEQTTLSKVTQRGAILGTPAFMPPEQAMALWENVDARSDVWALGATLFMLLTGDFVHSAVSGMQALDAAVTKHARSVASARAGLPADVVALVDRALAFEPSQRFQSAGEMQHAVRVAYAAMQDGARAPQLSVPDGDRAPRADAISTAPAPGHAAADEAPAAAKTIVSRKRRSRTHLRIGLALAAIVAIAVLTVVGRLRSTGSEPAGRASAAAAPASAGIPVLPAPVAEPEPPSAAVSASVRGGAPVLAVSALPLETQRVVAPSEKRRSKRHSDDAHPAPTAVPPPVESAPAVATKRPSMESKPASAEAPAKPAGPGDPFSGRF